MKIVFKIKGLDCANCASELESKIQKIEGMQTASISFMTERLTVEYEGEKEEIIAKIKKVIKKEEPDVSIEEIEK
ncbi:MAG: heavy metal transporter [Clostridia bacterium]|jgi:cation transport ATPase|nr:heavy metal transporter [Clostridia bacterium]